MLCYEKAGNHTPENTWFNDIIHEHWLITPLLLMLCLALISGCSQQTRSVNIHSPSYTSTAAVLKDLQFKYRHLEYASDKEQFGVEDHWQTPTETKANGFYDCEDIAFLYYFELVKNGHHPELMYGVLPDGQKHLALSLNDWVLDGKRVYRKKHLPFKLVYSFTHNSIRLPAPPKYFKRYAKNLSDEDRAYISNYGIESNQVPDNSPDFATDLKANSNLVN